MSFTDVRVAENRVIARDLHHIEVDYAGTDIVADHLYPGQFVQLGVGGGKPGFYAVANAPWAGTPGRLEFLVKRSGETSAALCGLWPGAVVRSSAVMGQGFPMDLAEGRPLLIFCVGSGISAVRSVLESEACAAGERPVHLFYGALDRGWMAYTERFARWRAAGVHVHTTLDEEPEDSGYTGPRGRVQELFQARPPAVDMAEAAVLLCGMKSMVEEVREMVTGLGVDASRVLLNF
ncbi:MAG: FAD-dependent oxidoreductase [Alphaproteobacteria bacterium]|nr:FAD-dependent oxidoreductase [Alphaproteobacteria bacterium]